MSEVADAVKALDPKVVVAVAECIGGDGWAIFKPSAFVECGMPVDLVMEFVDVEESDTSHHKSTVFTKDGPLPDGEGLKGVYGLDLIERFTHILLPDFKPRLVGRGFRARACSEALIKHFKDKVE